MPQVKEPDDNTLDNAGPVGREMADQLSDRVIEAVEKFPHSSARQKVAIVRIAAMNLETWVEEMER